MANYIPKKHKWKVLHDLIFTRVQHYVDVWLFKLTSIGNFKEFTVNSVNHLSWESNLSISTNQWERLSWKTEFSIILASNTKWISSQQFGFDRAKLGPLVRGHLYQLIFITKLLLVWHVGHPDSHITDWVTKPSQVPWTVNLPTWMWCLNLVILLEWQSDRDMGKNLQKREGHFEIT